MKSFKKYSKMSADKAILHLSDRKPFGSGVNRLCFVHPSDDNLCIKVMKSGKDGKSRRAGLFLPILPMSWYDWNHREFNEYRRLIKIGDETIWRHISRHYGFVNTDIGVGAVTRLVRNTDGTIARPLSKITCRGDIPDAALEEFCAFLRCGYLCNWRDPGLGNIVCAHLTEGKRLVIVDGLFQKKLSFLIRRRSNILGTFPSRIRKKRAAQYTRVFEHSVSDMIERVRSINSVSK